MDRIEIEIGGIYGTKRVLSKVDKGSYYVYESICTKCGKITYPTQHQLLTKSCRCTIERTRDITGEIFGDRRVIGIDQEAKESGTMNYWLCECMYCGMITHVSKYDLQNGVRVKCRHEAILDPHTDQVLFDKCKTSHPLYSIYETMINNCYNPASKYHEIYYDAGIKVCDAWYQNGDLDLGFRNFFKWAIENGYIIYKLPSGRNCCRLIRLDSSKNYSPSNCEWQFLRAAKGIKERMEKE